MAATQLLDWDELFGRLELLERREREVSAYRGKLHDRITAFPNEVTLRQERVVSAERCQLHREIDLLRAQLGTVRREIEPEQ